MISHLVVVSRSIVTFLIFKWNIIVWIVGHISIRKLSKWWHHLSCNLRTILLPLLVPAPLVDLGLTQTSLPRNFQQGFFGPVWVPIKLSHQDLDLVTGLSLSLPDHSLIVTIIVHNVWSVVSPFWVPILGATLWWILVIIIIFHVFWSHTIFVILNIFLLLVVGVYLNLLTQALSLNHMLAWVLKLYRVRFQKFRFFDGFLLLKGLLNWFSHLVIIWILNLLHRDVSLLI